MINGKKMVSLCISRLHEQENYRFISKLNDSLNKLGIALFIYDIASDIYWNESIIRAEASVFDLVRYDKSDVVIIMHEKIKSKTITEKLIKRAKEHDTPVIVVDGIYEGCMNVAFDYAAGFRKIVEHVICCHGITDLHMFAGYKGNPYSDQREEVFKEVLKEHSIPFSDDMISYGQFWARPTIDAAEKLIASGKIPKAIVCANDIMAINVSGVLSSNGYRIPNDVLVTGFDGIDEINYTVPRISSVRCSGIELAKTIACIVERAIDENVYPDFTYVEPKLIINESCGCDTLAESFDTNNIQRFNDHFYQYQDDARVLSDMTDRMNSSETIAQASQKLKNSVIHDMCCLINKSCLDYTFNHFESLVPSGVDSDMFMFYDTDSKNGEQYDFNIDLIVPDLDKLLNSGMPLIFNVIDFMNSPIGYVCFHFKEFDLTSFCTISQIVSSIGRGLGGFMNMRFQNYLTKRIEQVYRYDGLTGLYNRVSFSHEYEKKLADITDENHPVTVILADLDGLKHINDIYGHPAGDIAIKTVASALKYACPPDTLCVRFGGDEMLAVVFDKCSSKYIRSKLKEYLKNFNKKMNYEFKISASIGVYETNTASDLDFETIIKKADAIMYVEKQAKKAKEAAH